MMTSVHAIICMDRYVDGYLYTKQSRVEYSIEYLYPKHTNMNMK